MTASAFAGLGMSIMAYGIVDVADTLECVIVSFLQDASYEVLPIQLPFKFKTINGYTITGGGNIFVQEQLVSGTNIKTVNGSSLLGSGNIKVQPLLISGTNIKTVNGNSLLGAGNIEISGSSSSVFDITPYLTSENSISVEGYNAV